MTGSEDEPYVEDIFVGYRYFETFGVGVRYPFGYGLSYTDFEYSNTTYSEANGKITVSVDVKNTGSRAGKEAVQCYYSAPQIRENGAKLTRPILVVDLNEEHPIKMVEIVPARATSFRKPSQFILQMKSISRINYCCSIQKQAEICQKLQSLLFLN